MTNTERAEELVKSNLLNRDHDDDDIMVCLSQYSICGECDNRYHWSSRIGISKKWPRCHADENFSQGKCNCGAAESDAELIKEIAKELDEAEARGKQTTV